MPEVAADPVVVTVATFNTAAGNSRYRTRGGFAETFVEDTAAILHQEICSHRRDDVVDPVDASPGANDRGRRLQWAFAGLVPGCGDPANRSYGNALRVAWESDQPVHEHVFRTVVAGDHARGALCWRGQLEGRWTTICSTHLSPGRGAARDEARRSQQRELLDFVESVRDVDDALIVGGDFNSRLASVVSANELGLVRVTQPAIDQLWTNGVGLATWTAPTDRSDHPRLYATIELPATRSI